MPPFHALALDTVTSRPRSSCSCVGAVSRGGASRDDSQIFSSSPKSKSFFSRNSSEVKDRRQLAEVTAAVLLQKTDPKLQQKRQNIKRSVYFNPNGTWVRLAPDREVSEVRSAKTRIPLYARISSPTLQSTTRLALQALQSDSSHVQSKAMKGIHKGNAFARHHVRQVLLPR